jgi:Chitobiase/beta-hexosaminidase C-terminal domain/IPT/TIG domain
MNRCLRAALLLSPTLVFLSIVCTPAVGSATTVATPTFSPAAGSYTGAQLVTISDATSGATIYHNTNGTTPTNSSTTYTAAISVSTSETTKAIAEHSGDTNSAVATAKYTIPPAIRSLSTTSGGLSSPVTITGTNFGATQSTNTVTFNGTPAAVTAWSSTSILVSVPLAANTGNVLVTVSGVASNGAALIALCSLRIRAMLSCGVDDFGQPAHLQVPFCAPLSCCDMS